MFFLSGIHWKGTIGCGGHFIRTKVTPSVELPHTSTMSNIKNGVVFPFKCIGGKKQWNAQNLSAVNQVNAKNKWNVFFDS